VADDAPCDEGHSDSCEKNWNLGAIRMQSQVYLSYAEAQP
jgi:hypothetical protein